MYNVNLPHYHEFLNTFWNKVINKEEVDLTKIKDYYTLYHTGIVLLRTINKDSNLTVREKDEIEDIVKDKLDELQLLAGIKGGQGE